MTKTLKRPEVLSPAGTLEKLKVAVRYGADAVFIGGQAYGLRSRAGNFTFEQMEEGVQFAAKYGAKVYVAANMDYDAACTCRHLAESMESSSLTN